MSTPKLPPLPETPQTFQIVIKHGQEPFQQDLYTAQQMQAYATAATEPLLQRIAEFVTALDEEMVVSHLGVFNPGGDPKKAIKDLMLWSQILGEYFAGEKAKERIAELEKERDEWKHDALNGANAQYLRKKNAELERQLEEARKQMDAQKDEWLSWEAKRSELEADAGRWRELEQGRGLTVVVPTPTDDKPDRKVTIIYSPNPYSAYPAALRKAIDAAMQKGQS